MSMDISKLPSNSNASKAKTQTQEPAQVPDEKRVGKVVTGKVKTKKNEVRKFTDIFIAEDANSVKSYILDDLLIPTVKNLFVDVIQNSVEMLILGGKRGGRDGRRASYVDNVSYRDYGRYSRDDRSYSSSRSSRNSFDYEQIVFETRRDAEKVLDSLDDIIRRFGLARVADLYDMCQMTAPYTAHDYGWTSLSRAKVVSVRGGGYAIDLPRASAID